MVHICRKIQEFHQYPDVWIHRFKQQSDTGIEIELLQEYVFVALDIFSKNLQNRSVNINEKLEAWLLFLSIDEPEWILKLLEVHPEFEALYQEVYTVCRNTEVMMGLFSEELLEMDKNTVEYMIDEMQNELDEMKKELEERRKELEERRKELEERRKELEERRKELEERRKELEQEQQEKRQLEDVIKDLKAKLAEK